jgi:hypothetical protein
MIHTIFLLSLTLSSKIAGRSCFNGSLTIYILVSLFVAQFLKDPTKLLCKNANKFKPWLTTQTSQRFLNFIRSQDLITSTLFKIELIEDTASFLPNLTIREIIWKSFKYLVKQSNWDRAVDFTAQTIGKIKIYTSRRFAEIRPFVRQKSYICEWFK